MMGFTASELAELAAYDAQVDAETPDNRELKQCDARDSAIVTERLSGGTRRERQRAAHRKWWAKNKERINAERRANYPNIREAERERARLYRQRKKEERKG